VCCESLNVHIEHADLLEQHEQINRADRSVPSAKRTCVVFVQQVSVKWLFDEQKRRNHHPAVEAQLLEQVSPHPPLVIPLLPALLSLLLGALVFHLQLTSRQ
jgi:hypothetical protein